MMSAAFLVALYALAIVVVTHARPRELQNARYFAEGGYQTDPVECVFPWTYTDANGDTAAMDSPCVSVEDFEPFMGSNQPPSDPANDLTNTSYWCSTTKEYEVDPAGNVKAVRKMWGYCLDTFTRSPTSSPSSSPSAMPSASPTKTVYLADGGGVEGGECILPFIYDGVTYDECVEFTTAVPFIPPENLFQPKFAVTDRKTWCAVEESEYIANPPGNDKSRRKLWGYCVKEADTLAKNTLFADGGFQTDLVPCATDWKFKDKSVSNNNLFDVSGRCITFDEFQPYGYNDDGVALLEPTQSTTNKSKWCSTTPVYNPAPDTDVSNRKNWGYCFDELLVDVPTPATTVSPSVANTGQPTSSPVVISAPVASPSTPTTSGPSSSPTIPFYADGGYQSSLVLCAQDWKFKEKIDGETVLHETSGACIPFDRFKPYGYDDEGAQLLEPTQATTDTALWCSTAAVYNPVPERDVENREQWGYCFSSQFTSAPTVTVVPTPPTTPQPSTSPVTPSPTITSPLGDGGGVQGGACILPFTDVSTQTTYHECASVADNPPYMGKVIDPMYEETDQLTWCAVEFEDYIKEPQTFDKSRRKLWAYCLPANSNRTLITNAPSTSTPTTTGAPTTPTVSFRADGGGAAGVRSCATSWKYKLPADSSLVDIAVPCISFDVYQPFGFNDPDVAVLPSDDLTDTNFWCSTADVYNPAPKLNNQANKFLWGYCLRSDATYSPSTLPPSATLPPSTTGSPVASTTMQPSTSSSDSNVPSSSPTTAGDLDLANFLEAFGINGLEDKIDYEVQQMPEAFRQNGALGATWEGSKKNMRITLNSSCTSEHEGTFYKLMKSSFPSFDFVASCVASTRRRLQDPESGAASELDMKVCDTGSCDDPTPQATGLTQDQILLIVIPVTIVALVALVTLAVVLKKRKGMRFARKKSGSSRFKKPTFPSMKGKRSSIKLPKLGRSRSKKSEKDSDVTTSFVNKPEDDNDVDYSAASTSFVQATNTTEAAPTSPQPQAATRPKFQYSAKVPMTDDATTTTYGTASGGTPVSTTNGTASTYGNSSTSAPYTTGTAAATPTFNSAGGTNATVESKVENSPKIATEVLPPETSVESPKGGDSGGNEVVEDAGQAGLSRAKSSMEVKKGKSDSGLKKMKCEKCSSTYYSASGKSNKCLKCRTPKKSTKCQQCGAKFISASGKSTKCLNCRET